MLIVYFSGVTGNTERYIKKSQVRSLRIPLKPSEEVSVSEKYVLVVPTYGSGNHKIPPQVKKFLAKNHHLLYGVIGTGNINFNIEYCLAAREISETYQVPLLAEVELAGMESDIKKLQAIAQGDIKSMTPRTSVLAEETPAPQNSIPSYMELNAKLGFYAEDGSLQLEKDKEAAREFMLEVNENTVFFHDIEEKQAYMVEHQHWDADVLAMYSPEFIKSAFKEAYSHKYRFQSFMSAFKFYTSYAQKTNDGGRYLERYEDRMTMIALTLAQGDESRVFDLIEDMVQNRIVFATPTMQNSGKARAGEKVSCFLLNASDSLDSIKDTWAYAAQLSKIGGGVAINMTDIREAGAPLKGKDGLAKGIIPWMKVYEDIFSTVDQLGTRQGAGAVYLSIFHPDVLSFLDSKKENADEKTRIKTLSTGLVVPDVFFELVKNNDDIHLISTYDASREYGIPFSQIDLTAEYQNILDNPRIRKPRKLKARALLQQIAEVQGESGYPYLMFVDTVNRAHNIDGKVVMSNLCVEIAQVTEPSTYNEETGEMEHVGRDISCNLASLNVYEAMRSKDFGRMVENAVRGLIAVSDMSDIKRVPTVANGNRKSHAIGLGQMGLATYFATEKMMYGDEESLDFTDIYFKTVFYHALRTSNLVAKERGESFYGFEKSKYYTGEAFEKYLHDDGQPKTEKVRKLFADAGIHIPTREDWEELKRSVREHGSYCAYLTAVAPTGSISYITNTSASIAPIVSKIEIRKEGKLGRVMYPAAHMTNENQEYFVDAYEVGWEKLIDVYAAATPHVDQSLSMTVFFNEGVTTRDYNKMQITAWRKGIKTIYYTRIRQKAIAGSDIEGCVSCAL